MYKIAEWRKIYFLGVGGIGMSALARYFKDQGAEVHGYDKTKTALTKKLEREGISIHYDDNEQKIPDNVDVVIYTPAIPKHLKIFRYCESHRLIMLKRAKVLGLISESSETIAIAGTHGKTTTSSMLSYILTNTEQKPTSILGGIPVDYDSNYINGNTPWIVTEADEYDRSFLHLNPKISVVTSVDPDHLDIYGDFEAMKEAFRDFGRRTRADGILMIHKEALEILGKPWRQEMLTSGVKVLTYGMEQAEVCAKNVRIRNRQYFFDIQIKEEEYKDFSTILAGEHNILNALVAITMAKEVGVEIDLIRKNLQNFRGIKRRFERVFSDSKLTIIDDYAHHPTEIKYAIDAARNLFPDRKLTVIFQPHLFTRTRDFLEGFAEELSRADELILVPIYPAREEPIEGICSERILEKVQIDKKLLIPKEEIKDYLIKTEVEVLLILGAGNIDAQVQGIKEALVK